MDDPDSPIVQAIAKSCQAEPVHRANAALPQFKVDIEMPESMLELLARLGEAGTSASDDPF